MSSRKSASILTDAAPGRFASLTRHIPPGQLGRYLLVGIWNTGFAYGTYAGFTALFDRRMPYGYLLASVLSNILNITVSFLGYKWFVFKTKGNYIQEWLRSLSVYGSSMLFGFLALAPLVYVFRTLLGFQHAAPYLAGAVLTGVSVLISFFGHKHISFRQKPGDTQA